MKYIKFHLLNIYHERRGSVGRVGGTEKINIIKDNLPKLSEDGIRPNSVVGKAAKANRCFWAASSESDIR